MSLHLLRSLCRLEVLSLQNPIHAVRAAGLLDYVCNPSKPTTSLLQLSGALRPVSRVAYQGVPGAYSEMACRKACPESEPLPCEQFEVAFQALSQWMVDRAVLPIENSLGGSIHAVYDLLLRYRLHIVGETSVAVNHCLMALPGSTMDSIKRVLSHPQVGLHTHPPA